MTQMQLPGMPRHSAVRVTLEVTLWPDGTTSAGLAVAATESGDEFVSHCYQQSSTQPQEQIGRLIHWGALQQSHILRRMADPFPPELWSVIDESRMLYDHLEPSNDRRDG